MKVILLTTLVLPLLSIIECRVYVEILRELNVEVRRAHEQCLNDTSVTPANSAKCALEATKLLNPAGELDFKQFPGYFKEVAQECDARTKMIEKPQMYQDFTTCFNDEANKVAGNIYSVCMKEFGISDIAKDLTKEMIETDQKLACMMNCMGVKLHVMETNGDFNEQALRVENDFQLNVGKAITNCQNANMQSDVCQRGANRYFCLTAAFNDAYDQFHAKDQ